MQKFIEVTGKTDEEALAKGLRELGLQRDDVSLEILERGRTGFLGIGSVPAKIRLTYEVPDEPEPAPEPEPVVSVPEPARSPAPAEEAARPAPEPRPRRQRERRREPRPAPEARPVPEAVPAAVPADAADDDVAAAIVAFQAGLFERMNVPAVSKVAKQDDIYQVTLEGSGLGALIGHRGETLDAVQQLTSYAVNRGRAHRVRIHVDAEGYRARREESLSRLAKKTAAKVARSHRSIALEPMNAYERHVIHAALQDFPGITTRSIGTDPNRRVVITCE